MSADKLRCPNCGSENTEATQRGFDNQKATIGLWLFGGLGLIYGGYKDRKDVLAKCLNCNLEWNHNQLLGLDFKTFKYAFYGLYEQKEYEKAKQMYISNTESVEAIDVHSVYLMLKKDDRRTFYLTLGFGIFTLTLAIFAFLYN